MIKYSRTFLYVFPDRVTPSPQRLTGLRNSRGVIPFDVPKRRASRQDDLAPSREPCKIVWFDRTDSQD